MNKKYEDYVNDFQSVFNKTIANSDLMATCNELTEKYNKRHLYKYRAINSYTIEEIIKQQVYFAEIKALDDIFDSKYFILNNDMLCGFDAAMLFAKKFSKSNEYMESAYKTYENRINVINEMAEKKVRIASFTQKK